MSGKRDGQIDMAERSLMVERGTLWVSLGALIFMISAVGAGAWKLSSYISSINSNIADSRREITASIAMFRADMGNLIQNHTKDLSYKLDRIEFNDFVYKLQKNNPQVAVPDPKVAP